MADSPDSILADAREQLEKLGNTDLALDVVRIALAKQRRLIVRRIRSEARLAALGQYPGGRRFVSYDAGMRRAARVAESAGEAR